VPALGPPAVRAAMVVGAPVTDDGSWKLACRLGFAWRRSKIELFDCELEGIGDVVDALGLQLVQLGCILRPGAGLSAKANLKKSRPDVQLAASMLATLAGAGRVDVVSKAAALKEEKKSDGAVAPSTPPPLRRRLGLGVSAPPLPRPGLEGRKVHVNDDVVLVSIPARPPTFENFAPLLTLLDTNIAQVTASMVAIRRASPEDDTRKAQVLLQRWVHLRGALASRLRLGVPVSHEEVAQMTRTAFDEGIG
jgi:hypothetical protein